MALYDPVTSTLTVRNTAPHLELVGMFVESGCHLQYRSISFTVHLIEAPDAVLALNEEVSSQKNAFQHLSNLFDLATKPGSPVRILHTAFLETPSGQRATLESVSDHEYTKRLAVDAQGRAAVEGLVRPLGFRLEIDPVIEADGFTVQFKFLAQTVALPDPPPGPSPQFETGKVETEQSIASGRTSLAGMWPAGEGRSHAVFLTAYVIPQQPVRSVATSLTNLPKEAETMMEHTFVLPSQFLRRKSDGESDWSELPPLKGLELPPGSKVSVGTQGLTVRTTAEMMTVVDASVQHLLDTLPKSLTFRLEVFHAPANTMRQLVTESASLSDHSSALQKLKAAVTAGTATQEILNTLETNGGRAKLSAHLDRHVVTELNWLNDQPPGVATRRRPSGLDFEIDSQVTGESAFPFSFALERHFTPLRPWSEPLLAAGSDRPLLMPRDEFPCVRIQCSSRIIDGHTKLIGVWRPVSHGGALTDDVLEAAFITCRVIRHVLNDGNKIASPISETPKGKASTKPPLLVRTFKVPGDFLSFDAPLDPFTTGQLPARDGWQDTMWEHHGISFPEGAHAVFDAVAGTLTVSNTEENLMLIESLIKQSWQKASQSVSVRLHLFEASVSELRSYLANHMGASNHAAALKQLMDLRDTGNVRLLTSLRIVADSGHTSTVARDNEVPFLSKIKVNKAGLPHIKRTTKNSGTSFAVEPTLAPDRLTINLTCSLTHHPAPPVSRTENLSPPGSPPIEIPLTDFHVESYEGSVTMTTGTSRILAVWKPTGRPEFAEEDLLHIAILEAHVVPME